MIRYIQRAAKISRLQNERISCFGISDDIRNDRKQPKVTERLRVGVKVLGGFG